MVKDLATRLWYGEQDIMNGWSHDGLADRIRTGLHQRQGRAVTNQPQAARGLKPRSDGDPSIQETARHRSTNVGESP